MSVELVQSKLDTTFQQLDADGNGVIERADLVALGTRMLANFGEPPSSAKGIALMQGLDRIWTALADAIDSNGDGRIDPGEFKTGYVSAFIESNDGYERAFQPAVEAVFALGDTDDDGSLSRAEFHKIQQAFGNPSEGTDAAFDKFDVDGSGALEVSELHQRAREFYTGDADDAIGNWLFGPVRTAT